MIINDVPQQYFLPNSHFFLCQTSQIFSNSIYHVLRFEIVLDNKIRKNATLNLQNQSRNFFGSTKRDIKSSHSVT